MGLDIYVYFRKCVQSSIVLFNPRLKFVARTSMFWKEEFISTNRLYFKHVLWNNLETAFRSAVASAVTSAWVGHRRSQEGEVTWGDTLEYEPRSIRRLDRHHLRLGSSRLESKDKGNGGFVLSGLL